MDFVINLERGKKIKEFGIIDRWQGTGGRRLVGPNDFCISPKFMYFTYVVI